MASGGGALGALPPSRLGSARGDRSSSLSLAGLVEGEPEVQEQEAEQPSSSGSRSQDPAGGGASDWFVRHKVRACSTHLAGRPAQPPRPPLSPPRLSSWTSWTRWRGWRSSMA